MQNSHSTEVIIIGAGQSGLSTSYFLKKDKVPHVLFERGQIGDSWLHRWDSFTLNSSNAFNLLPGEILADANPDEFISGVQFALRLQKYASENQLPVRTLTKVVAVDKDEKSGRFNVVVDSLGETQHWHCQQLILASGAQIAPKIPAISIQLPQSVYQIHSSAYRNPKQLPNGAVLVVGGATSGVQIAEELIQSGREVFLSTSTAPRVPRRYRGKDTIGWLTQMGIFDKPTSEADDFELNMKAPLMSGLGELGHTISLQQLHKMGVMLLGKLQNIEGNLISFDDSLVANVQFGDMFSAEIKDGINQFIAAIEMDAPAPEPDEADNPANLAQFENAPGHLDVEKENISTVIWCTGFTHDLNWINLPLLDERGKASHTNGISLVPNVYFMGLEWQRNLKSSLIYGAAEDAKEVVRGITQKNYETMEVNA